jgi:preprotein translocase subunit SecA
VIEGQRRAWRAQRDDVLFGRSPCGSDGERLVTLDAIDEAWSDYLAAIAELRAGTPWQSLGGQDPLRTFVGEAHAMHTRMTASIDEDVQARLASSAAGTAIGRQRGATWTFLTTDEPFGPMTERVMRGLVRLFPKITSGVISK